MGMQKGLCIELNGSSSVFIGPNGEFVHGTPAREIAVGEETYFYPKQISTVREKRMIKPIWASVAASFAVALLFLSVLLPKQEAYAYVQVQVNPGIELGIDENYKVISVRELNDDGYDLISAMAEWQDQPLDIVLENVVQLSLKGATEVITITTVADKDDAIADDAIVDAVMAISSKVLAGDIAVQLKDASRDEWRTSIENNVPAGQLVKDSKKLTNEEQEEPIQGDKKEKAPFKESDSDDNPPPKEMKPDSNLKEKSEEPASSDTKATPPGQEQRKQNPAAEKGKNQPPGQEKRNEVPGQKKKDDQKGKAQPQEGKGKDTAPGQQKKSEDKNEGKGNGNGNGPPSKNDNSNDNSNPSNSNPSEKDKDEDSNKDENPSSEKGKPEKKENTEKNNGNQKEPGNSNDNGNGNNGNSNGNSNGNNGNGEGNNN